MILTHATALAKFDLMVTIGLVQNQQWSYKGHGYNYAVKTGIELT